MSAAPPPPEPPAADNVEDTPPDICPDCGFPGRCTCNDTHDAVPDTGRRLVNPPRRRAPSITV